MERKQLLKKQPASTPNFCCAQIYVDPHSLTAEENYRINGVLTTFQIEECLDALESVERIPDIDSHIQEASVQYPEEDFLADIISNIQTIADRLRKGDNKDDLNEQIEALTELQSSVNQSAEQGRDELDKARKEMEAMELW